MRKHFFIVAINVVLTLLMVVILELIIRASIPEIKFPGTDRSLIKENVYKNSAGLMPLAKGISSGALKEVDKDGFWKYSGNTNSPKKQILFIGDSVTMGIGVKSDSTFAGRLAERIDSVNILNPSLIGNSSADYLNIINFLINEEHNKFDITEVFIFWCLNDLYQNYGGKSPPGFEANKFPDNIISFFRNNFKLYHFLKKISTDRPKTYYLFDEQFYQIDNPHFQESINNILAMQSILKSKNVEMSLIMLPYEYQLRNQHGDLFKPQNTFVQALEEHGIAVFDLAGEINKDIPANSGKLYLYGDGIHFSNSGHEVLSQILADKYFGYRTH